MANKRTTVFLHGRLYWAKIFGTPRPNYDGDAREWTLEFEPDAASTAELQKHGLGDRIKDKRHKKGYEDRAPFIILRRNEFKVDGERNDPIRVVAADGNDWPSNTLIGNETEADVKAVVVDYGPRKKSGIYPLAIRVLEFVPYKREEFAPLPEDDPRRQAAAARREAEDKQFKADFGMDDDEDVEVKEEPPFDMDDEEEAKPKNKKAKDDLDDDVDL